MSNNPRVTKLIYPNYNKVDENTNVIKEYVYNNSTPIASITSTKTYKVYADHLDTSGLQVMLIHISKKSLETFIIVMIMFSFVGCSSGVEVSIKNNSLHDVNELVLVHTGGHINIDKLNSLDVWEGTIHVSSESHIEMDFSSHEDKKYHYNLDVYIEKGNSGSISIIISNENKIIYVDRIEH